MKAFIPNYTVVSATSLDNALTLLLDAKRKPIAGGTDIMVLLEAGKLPEGTYIDITGIEELKGIHVSDDAIEIGALTTYSEIREHPILKTEFPMLVEAAKLTGALAIQNRGTIGGNIVNASPAADTPPALLCYDTELELLSTKGARILDYADFHKGYKKMDLEPGELLSMVRIKRNTEGTKQFYHKVGTRKAQAISKACVAMLFKIENQKFQKVRLAMGSVGPVPLRCHHFENALLGKAVSSLAVQEAVKQLDRDITPLDDIRSTGEYRRTVAANIVRDILEDL